MISFIERLNGIINLSTLQFKNKDAMSVANILKNQKVQLVSHPPHGNYIALKGLMVQILWRYINYKQDIFHCWFTTKDTILDISNKFLFIV